VRGLKPLKPFEPSAKPCCVSGPIAVEGPSPDLTSKLSSRHSAPADRRSGSTVNEVSKSVPTSKFTPFSVCMLPPGWKRKPSGCAAPSDALTVL